MNSGRYKLFGCAFCGSMITEAFLRFAEIPYDYQELDWEDRSNWGKHLGQLNPLLQVPTLVLPNGTILTETLATAVHAAKFKPGLIPPVNHPSYETFWRWALFLVTTIYPTATYHDNAEKFLTHPEQQKELQTAVLEKRKVHWQQFEQATRGPWFLGETFSAIDIYLGIATYWRPRKDWFAVNCPKIFKIAERIRTLEPYATLIHEHEQRS